ncbi:outer membrane lipoprotein LolB [Delftia tsuruhatensis]|uniref:outer membrane lipoprotein LolB n=1 Tax=Delftia tsuruhatensis TaxID=180282 RepID=UPI001E6E08E9|nr:outer membrane lipoprotein LolB [Delftia tsuruhatensis]CAB5667648.1 outer membrane lipoprotein LolB [Delftia tsuruhatensis]CAC9678030.1 outer membrane lipoprotein LolB [Delftia tsuruhatensis]
MPIQPRSLRRRQLCAAAASLALLALAGCALPPRQLQSDDTATAGHWSGRLALQVEDAQNQSFSAGFELLGTPVRGELLLFTPLGSTLARLLWAPGQASLQQGEDRKTSDSLAALVQELTGSDLPIAALFDWLQGRATAAAGWDVDLSRVEQGRLVARRHDPQPPAALRIVLDMP